MIETQIWNKIPDQPGKALVVGNVVIRQTDGAVRSLQGSKVKVISGRKNFCLCDIGRAKPIFIPTNNLKAA